MKKIIFSVFALLLIASCVIREKFKPDFNKYVDNVIVISATRDSVVYEYTNVRVDELAMLAALYCQDQGNQKASLLEITLQKNNARRAAFMCEPNTVSQKFK